MAVCSWVLSGMSGQLRLGFQFLQFQEGETVKHPHPLCEHQSATFLLLTLKKFETENVSSFVPFKLTGLMKKGREVLFNDGTVPINIVT